MSSLNALLFWILSFFGAQDHCIAQNVAACSPFDGACQVQLTRSAGDRCTPPPTEGDDSAGDDDDDGDDGGDDANGSWKTEGPLTISNGF